MRQRVSRRSGVLAGKLAVVVGSVLVVGSGRSAAQQCDPILWGVLAAADDEKPGQQQVPGEKSPKDGLRKAAQEALKEIPLENLPARTRPQPDPSRDRYVLDPVFVWVEEVATPEQGDRYVPEVRVTENYIKGYLQRAGHPVVKDPSRASLRVEGNVKLQFHSTLTSFGRKLGWKYRAEASFRVLDAQGNDNGSFEIPQIFQESVHGEKSAALQVRRYMAKLVWENLYRKVPQFSQPKAVDLINSLVVEDSEPVRGAAGEKARRATAEDVVKALADIGFPAVPFLLDALADKRVVRKPSSYPGLAGGNLDDLRIYHIADKALEEIFQKVSRLNLSTPEKFRRLVARGWEREWKRFCPSYAAFLAAQQTRRKQQDAR